MDIFMIRLLQFMLAIGLLVLLHEGGHFFFSCASRSSICFSTRASGNGMAVSSSGSQRTAIPSMV